MKANPCILVVEHDASIREFIASALVDEGFQTCMAPTSRMAISQLSATRPCLLLVDINDVSLDDLNLISEYRDLLGNEAAVAVMSTTFHIENLGNSVQADAVLSKPFNLSDLFEIVSRCGHVPQFSAAS